MALQQAVRGAGRAPGTTLAAQYRRIADRRDAKRAITAIAHRPLSIAYHVIACHEPYRERGSLIPAIPRLS